MKRLLALLLLMISAGTCWSYTLIPYKKDGKWGYADISGKVIVEPIYTTVSDYNKDLQCYIVSLNYKYGIINKKGEKVSEVIYDRIFYMSSNSGLITELDGKYGVMDYEGKVLLPNEYKKIWETHQAGELYYLKEGLSGRYSFTEKAILEEKVIVKETGAGRAVAVFAGSSNNSSTTSSSSFTSYDIRYLEAKHNAKYKIIKETVAKTYQNGRSLNHKTTLDTLEFEFDKVIVLTNYHKLHASLFVVGGKWGIVYNDEVVVKPEYDSISSSFINHACENFYFMVKKKSKWGLVDTAGNVLIPAKYDEIINQNAAQKPMEKCFEIENGIQVRKKNRYGIISINNEILVPIKQDSILYSHIKTYYTYFRDNRQGMYSARFKTKSLLRQGEEFSDIVEIHGVTLIGVVDKNRIEEIKWRKKGPYFKGYMNSTGVRFYKD